MSSWWLMLGRPGLLESIVTCFGFVGIVAIVARSKQVYIEWMEATVLSTCLRRRRHTLLSHDWMSQPRSGTLFALCTDQSNSAI